MSKYSYDLVLFIPSTNKEVYYFKLLYGHHWLSESDDFSEVFLEMLKDNVDLIHYLHNISKKGLVSRVVVRRMKDHEA